MSTTHKRKVNMTMNPTVLLTSVAILLTLVACTQPGEAPVQSTQELTLNDGDVFRLDARQVTKVINGVEQEMYGYNGQIPGPRLRVRQGSTIYVNFTNNLPEDTTVHWHGLRHNFKDDGVPGISQDPVKPGESFLYTLQFPDDGIFWYHPHIRDDRQQDLGLYANIIVEPMKPLDNPVQREEFLMIDDILLEDGKNVAYGKEKANFALMGRFGNTMLTNGETTYELAVPQGETVRFYITAVANARPFNLSIGGLQMKRIGSDFGRYERETLVDSIILGTAERATVEMTFTETGTYTLRNVNMWEQYDLGTITVTPSNERYPVQPPLINIEASEDIAKYEQYFGSPVDEEIVLGIEFNHEAQEMHSVTNIEWEDTMLDENKETSSDDVTWFIEDKKTKARNKDLVYQFQTGSVKKIRFVNDKESLHPMQHYIHLHGQRFLVLEQDGMRNDNLVWKDTFLIPSGSTADILLDNSNPGEWVFHCHIPEHMEAGMMSTFIVSETGYQESTRTEEHT